MRAPSEEYVANRVTRSQPTEDCHAFDFPGLRHTVPRSPTPAVRAGPDARRSDSVDRGRTGLRYDRYGPRVGEERSTSACETGGSSKNTRQPASFRETFGAVRH